MSETRLPYRALDPWERQALLTGRRPPHRPRPVRKRCRLVLAWANGVSISDIRRREGIPRRHISKWLKRFEAEGLVALTGRPRGGERTQHAP